MKKRPAILNVLAIFVILSVPGDLFTAVTFDKDKYKEDIRNTRLLIESGAAKHEDRIVYWKEKSDVEKKLIIARLTIQEKISSRPFLFRIFKCFCAILSLLVFYVLWNMKKWAFMVLLAQIVFLAVFNIIFTFFTHFLFLFIPYVLLIVLFFVFYRKYFVH